MPLTIVHCADVHLDTTFAELRGGAFRRAALADAFHRIVNLALERNADVLTIGGDLYEAERVGPQTVRFLFEEFARFGRPIVIAPGNHDPFTPSSPYARADLPGNVRVCNETSWRTIELAERVTLYGFGHTAAEPGRPFAHARFAGDGIRIALVHGSDEERCPPHKRPTAPFTLADAAAAGAHFVLTGHFHGGYVADRDGRPALGYPGSPEPIKFGESDAHGALAVRIDDGGMQVESVAIARTRLVDLACDLSGAEHDRAVGERVAAQLEPYGRNDFVRLRLTGEVAPDTRIEPATIGERFGDALGALDVRDDTVSYDRSRIAAEPTVRGRVVADLLARIERGDDDAGDALRYALAAFSARDIAP